MKRKKTQLPLIITNQQNNETNPPGLGTCAPRRLGPTENPSELHYFLGAPIYLKNLEPRLEASVREAVSGCCGQVASARPSFETFKYIEIHNYPITNTFSSDVNPMLMPRNQLDLPEKNTSDARTRRLNFARFFGIGARRREEAAAFKKEPEPKEKKPHIAKESWASFIDEMKQLPRNFFNNLKANWKTFAGALALYGAGSYLIQRLGLPRLQISECTGLSATAMAIGFWTTFFGDGYGQTALYESKIDWKKVLRRATVMGAGAGAMLSGIFTDNTLGIINGLTKSVDSALLKGAALLAGVQLVLMPPFMYAFLKIRDLTEKRIGLDKNTEEAKRSFGMSYWKSLFLGVPGNVVSCMILPYFAEAIRYPVMMFVSFTYFLVRTIATEQRWGASKPSDKPEKGSRART